MKELREILEKFEDRSEYLNWNFSHIEVDEVIYLSFPNPSDIERYQLGHLPQSDSVIVGSNSVDIVFRLWEDGDMATLERLLKQSEDEAKAACMNRGTEPESPLDARWKLYEQPSRTDEILDALEDERASYEEEHRYVSPCADE